MANQRKVGLKIEIDGEKEYKQAISELSRDNAVLSSELRKVTEQYKGNEDSIEALTAKARIYADQLDTQTRKVEETRERYNAWQAKLEEVRKTFGATSDEYQQAQKQVAVLLGSQHNDIVRPSLMERGRCGSQHIQIDY